MKNLVEQSKLSRMTYRRPTEEQRKSIADIESSFPVTAGAGSGKTFVLTHRYFQILAEQTAGLDEILTITFTEKAANQMQDKIRGLITRFARGEQPGEFPPVPLQDTAIPDQSYWEELLDTFERAYISTIHGFCARIIRESAVEVGLDPGFDVMDERMTALNRPEVVRQTLFDLIRRENESVALWLRRYSLGQILRTFHRMIRHRIEYSELPDFYLSDDSEESHLRRIKDRLRGSLTPIIQELAGDPSWLGIAGDIHRMEPLDDSDKFFPHWQRIREILDGMENTDDPLKLGNLWSELEEHLKSKGSKKNWDGVDLTDLKQRMMTYRDEILAPAMAGFYRFREEDEREALRLAKAGADIFRHVLANYRQWKREHNYLDYDDLLELGVNLLAENDELRRRYAEQFRYILVDEFQDTNPIQYKLVRLLGQPDDSGQGSVFIVGDPKQSIYRFRGTEVELFGEAKDFLPDRERRLDISFRSQPSLLGWFNACFSRIMGTMEDPPGASYEQRYMSLSPDREELPADLAPVTVNLIETGQSRYAHSVADKCQLEAAHIAHWLRQHAGDIRIEDEGEYRQANWGDVALLLRTTTHLKQYEHALRVAGIPYTTSAGAGLLQSQEIRDILNVLEALVRPANEIAVVGALRSNIFGLSDEALLHLSQAGYRDHWDAVLFADEFVPPPRLSEDDRLALTKAREYIQHWNRLKDRLSPGDLVDRICIESGYIGSIARGSDGTKRFRNVETFIALARDFSRSQLFSLDGFVDYIFTLQETSDEEEAEIHGEDRNAVHLMTIHRAKGLEFPVVVVPNLNGSGRNSMQRDFHPDLGWALKWTDPSRPGDEQSVEPVLYHWIRDREKRRDLAEAKRLFYVASTRTRDHLLLSGVVDGEDGVRRLTDNADYSRDHWLEWVLGVLSDLGWEPEAEKVESDATTVVVHRHRYDDADTLPSALDLLGETDRETDNPVHVPGEFLSREEVIRRWEYTPSPAIPDEINPSSLPLFREDRDQFYLRHILGVPELHPEGNGETGNGRQYGILAHSVLERDVRTGSRRESVEIIREVLRQTHHQTADVERALIKMLERFRKASIHSRIIRARPETEVRFLTEVAGTPMSGQIDLLLKDPNGLTVIDYKTDGISPEDIAKKMDFYRPQLLAYAYGVYRSTGDLPRSVELYFTKLGTGDSILLNEDHIREFEKLIGDLLDFVRNVDGHRTGSW